MTKFFRACPEVTKSELCFGKCGCEERKHFGGISVGYTIKEAWICSKCGKITVEEDAIGPLDDIEEKIDRILKHFGLLYYD